METETEWDTETETETETETKTEKTETETEMEKTEMEIEMETETETETKKTETKTETEWEMETEVEMTEFQMEMRRETERQYYELMEERKKMLEYEAKMLEDDAKNDPTVSYSAVPTNFGLGYPDHLTPPKEPILLYGKPKKSWSFNMNVSSIAIERFMERLLGDQERCMKRLVYLCLSSLSASVNMSWLAFNGNDGPEEKEASWSCVDDAMTNLESGFPSELLDLTCYGCAVWNSSKIIIAGGKNCKGDPSDKVFFYDTVSKTWEPPSRMNTTRGENPTVIVVDTRIFVFAGTDTLPAEYYGPLYKFWAEVYDSFSSSWLPLPRLPWRIFVKNPFPNIISHAVYPRRNRILLWLDHGVVLYFNYRCEKWRTHKSLSRGPQWNARVVVFEDFLIWHRYGTIYAHDLINDVTIPMYALPRTDVYSALFSNEVPSPGFLVHIGRGKLCLFYRVDNCVRYITFLVQISEGVGPAIPHTVVYCSGVLEAPPVTDVYHALEISS